MDKRFKKTVLAATLSSALMITACGGGGTASPVGGDDLGSINGTAAKGIIKNGLVTAIEMNGTGGELRRIGQTSTDDKGQYSIPMSADYEGGPIKVTIEAQENSEMVCDVHSDADDACEFGASVPLSSGFSMDAILPEATTEGDISLPITPLTHMAASRALNSGEAITKESVNDAISEVNQIVGLDILSVKPIDVTDEAATSDADADEKTYAAFIAGIGRLALENESGLNAGMDAVAESFADGKLDADEAIAPAKIIEAVKDEATESELGAEDSIASLESRVTENGSFDPEPLDVGITDLAQGKALVSDVRTWLTSLSDYQNPVDAFAGDVELAGELFDADVENHVELYGLVMEDVALALEEIPGTSLVGSHTVTVLNGDKATDLSVAISKTGVDNGLVIDVPETTITSTSTKVALNITTNLPETALGDAPFSLSKIDLKVTGGVSNADTSVSLDQVHVVLEADSAVALNTDVEPDPVAKGATFDGDFTIVKTVTKESASVDYTFVGNTGLKLVKLVKQHAVNDVSLKQVKIDGSITASDGRSLTAKVQLDAANAASFDTFAFMDHEPEVNVWNSEAGDVFGIWDNVQAPSELSDVFHMRYTSNPNETCHYGYNSSLEEHGEICEAGDTYGIVTPLGNQLRTDYPALDSIESIYVFTTPANEGDGLYTQYSADLGFSDFETANNFLKAKFTAETELHLTGLPGAKLVLTADRTELESGTASLAFIQGSVERFKLSAGAEDGVGSGEVVIKNSDGVAMTITPDADFEVGTIKTNGNAVGVVEERNDAYVIVWADGSIESLQ